MKEQLRERVRQVVDVLDSADEARAAGDLELALERFVEAEGRLRDLVAADPDEPAHLHTLGSTLYNVGEVRLGLRDPAGAVDTLGQAEETYQTLGGMAGAPEAVPLWIADVQVRRARALGLQGRGASALVDAQAGLLAYRERWSTGTDDPLTLDVARVLAWHASVTAWIGDPDVAVAAADTAIRQYLARAGEINADIALRVTHLPSFVLAARLAAVIHRAHGRDELAQTAGELADAASAAPITARLAPVPSVREVAETVTAAQALELAGADALAADLTAPAIDCRILMPLDRAAPQLAPAQASRLAEVAEALIDDHAGAGMRLALEAHAMFAGASQLQVLGMRYQFGDWGPSWAALLVRASHAAWEAGRVELAGDLADWMAGVVDRLAPFLPIDRLAREAALPCLAWEVQLRRALGDEQAASQAEQALRMLESLGGP